jgi:hypothetical protein
LLLVLLLFIIGVAAVRAVVGVGLQRVAQLLRLSTVVVVRGESSWLKSYLRGVSWCCGMPWITAAACCGAAAACRGAGPAAAAASALVLLRHVDVVLLRRVVVVHAQQLRGRVVHGRCCLTCRGAVAEERKPVVGLRHVGCCAAAAALYRVLRHA